MKITQNTDIYYLFSSKINCIAREVWVLEQEKDIEYFYEKIKNEKLWVIIGRGSNLIPEEDKFNGVVVVLGGEFLKYEANWHTGEVIAGAGVPLPSLARLTVDNGWEGFERFGGIPGTIGGAVVMNAGVGENGKYSVGPFVESVLTVNNHGALCWEKVYSSDFTYRKSVFTNNPTLILKVKLKFRERKTPMELTETFKQNMQYRKETQPLQQPNWGSTFVNPPHLYAAQLIESCGLKGYTIGQMQVSPKHANFFVNLGAAKAKDAIELIQFVQQQVLEKKNIPLQREVHYLHEEALKMKKELSNLLT